MSISPRKKQRTAQSRPNRRQLRLELLEDRSLLSTFTVLNTSDSGPGSLRQAILDANAATGANSIVFDIGGGGAQTISPLSSLPALGNSITLGGSTQPGFSGTPLIAITGQNNNGEPLTVSGNDNTIRGLMLEDSGITVGGSSNLIGGTTAAARNVVSGCIVEGIAIGGNGNIVEGNFIGTDPTGMKSEPNGIGILISNATSTIIGGTMPGAGNLISGNARGGVDIENSSQCAVEGNLIGTDVTGTLPLGNGLGEFGVELAGATNCTIGSATPAARNLISGNRTNVEVGFPNISTGLTNDLIEGNLIGTQIDGQHPLNSIGFPPASNDLGTGIVLDGNQNTVSDNVIGFNVQGIAIFPGAAGGFEPGGGNLPPIPPAMEERISQNSMFDNIDSSISGVPSGNNSQAPPTLTSQGESGNQTVITGTLSSAANTTYALEFFSATDRDFAGGVEGRTYLGSMNVTTDGSGNASFTFTGPASSAPFFTATTTDPSGNTSTFWQPNFPTPSITGVSVIGLALLKENPMAVTVSVTGSNLYTSTSTSFAFASQTYTGSAAQLVSPTEIQSTLTLSPGPTSGSLTVANGTASTPGGQSNAITLTITPDDLFVAGVYSKLLNRGVEVGGLQSWVNMLNSGTSPAQIAADIEASAEYRTDQVESIYGHYLGRGADPAGLAVFVSFLEHGDTVEQVIASVVGSTEYYQNHGGGTHNGFLSALYQDALNRPIDPGGQAGWNQAFANGATTYQIAGAILTSQEYRQDLITSYYSHYLGRQPDSGGLNGWLMQLNQGVRDETIVAGILGSAEYFNNPQP